MRAAVVHALGGVPIVEEFADPRGDDVAEVVATPLNPSDLMVVAGQMAAGSPLRRSSPALKASLASRTARCPHIVP